MIDFYSQGPSRSTPLSQNRLFRAASKLFALASVLVFGLALNWHSTLLAGEPSDSVQKPKGVVLVMIDDIGYGDVDFLSPSDLETPHIDQFGKQSVRLTDFHVGTTCSPTRASLMTGRYVNATGVWHTIAGRSILRENEQTIADVFQANGWRTGVFGKWHLGDSYPYQPRFRGFETSVIHGGGGVGQQPDYWRNDYYASKGETTNHKGKPTGNDHYFHSGEITKADEFCTDYWFTHAFKFMEASLKEEKPFFCYISTNAAHGPFNAPPGGKAGFDGLVENIDENMGRLEQFLIDNGIRDDVMVIFTSDNGTAGKERMGGLRAKKGSHYDGGHRVPCFIRWPNGAMGGGDGREIGSLTAVADLFPTFVELFDLNRPEGGQPIHGSSWKTMFLDQDDALETRTWIVDTQRKKDLIKWHKSSVMQDQVVDGKISHKWRLTRQNAQSEFELYDVINDRAQENNVLAKHPEVVKELKSHYEEWWQEISSQTNDYCPAVIGVQPETILYSHDWITKNGSPWHQNNVLNGNPGSGISAVRFAKAGRYRVELRRWPREDGGAIDGRDSKGRGTAHKIVKATLAIKGVGDWETAVPSGENHAAFEVDIEADHEAKDTTLKTTLVDDTGKVVTGAFYVYISEL